MSPWSRIPDRRLRPEDLPVSGTRDIEQLSEGVAGMVGRIRSLEREHETTTERMVHSERLAALG